MARALLVSRAMRHITLPYAIRIEPDPASLAEHMPTMPVPCSGPVRLRRSGSLPPPSSAPRTRRSQVPLPSTIRSPVNNHRTYGTAAPVGSSNDDQGHLRYLRLLPRPAVARWVDASEPVLEPEPAPPPTPQELDAVTPEVSPPRPAEPSTVELVEAMPTGDLCGTFRRRGSLRWIAAAAGGLLLAACSLAALAVLVAASVLGQADPPPPAPVHEANVAIRVPQPAETEPAMRSFAPEPVTRSRASRRRAARPHRRHVRSPSAVNADALLAAAGRRARIVDPDALLSAATRRRGRRSRNGLRLPAWAH